MCENFCGVYIEPLWIAAIKCGERKKKKNQDNLFKCESHLNFQELHFLPGRCIELIPEK